MMAPSTRGMEQTMSGPRPRIVSVAHFDAPHRYAQEEVKCFIGGVMAANGHFDRRLMAVFDNAGVESRGFIHEKEWYLPPRGFCAKNEAFVDGALSLILGAIDRCLEGAGVGHAEVDHIIMVTSTGIATPSLDALALNMRPFRADIRRTPVWGLGCLGGAAGLRIAHDLARSSPRACVLVVAVEVCSLAFRSDMGKKVNLISSAIFADGAAAALVVGPGGVTHGKPGPELVASASMTFPDTEDVMGWEVTEDGLAVIMRRDLPQIVKTVVCPAFDELLGRWGTGVGELGHWVVHPGGPKVLESYREALGLGGSELRHSENVLRKHGNMSSPTVLYVLEDFLENGEYAKGERGVITALGPGFSSEALLFEIS